MEEKGGESMPLKYFVVLLMFVFIGCGVPASNKDRGLSQQQRGPADRPGRQRLESSGMSQSFDRPVEERPSNRPDPVR